jgi:hypothetical protein
MAWTVNLTNNSPNAQVSNAIADGSFSYQEVLQLLNTVEIGGLTQGQSSSGQPKKAEYS